MNRTAWSVWGCFFPAAILFFGLFGKAILPENQFVYRDASYFYYPLYRQVQEELNAGRLPLWDDRSNFGQPLLANPATGVFYPPKLIFFTTKFFPDSYALCYKTFILLHFPAAIIGMYLLLRRRFGRGTAASALAATVYAFCGPIFFQYCNIIFLIGAAWFPWIILAGDRVLTERSVRSVLLLGLFLALPVTGGEPETAYLAGLVLLGLWLFRRRRPESLQNGGDTDSAFPISAGKQRRLERKKRKERKNGVARLLQSGPALLLAGAIFGALLSAATILPAVRAERLSHRNHKVFPTNLWELPRFLWTGRVSTLLPPDYRLTGPTGPQVGQSRGEVAFNGLFCRYMKLDGHENQVYDYSHAPWRFPEFLWPHFAGNDLSAPGTEWKTTLPNEFGWVQTSYMGILPLVFALTVFRLRRRKSAVSDPLPKSVPESARLIRWASWGALLFLLAALGGFGPWWFVRAAMWTLSLSDASLRFDNGDPVGGVYWIMNVFLPKFSLFRFPAKMLTPALFFLTTLSAFGFDLLFAGTENAAPSEAESANARKRAVRIAAGILALTGVVFLAAILLGPSRLYAGAPASTSFGGAFEPEKSFRFLLFSLLQPAAVLLLFLPFLFRKQSNSLSKTAFLAAVLLTAADLFFADAGSVPTIAQKTLDETPVFAETLEKNRTLPPDGIDLPVRIHGYYNWNDPRFTASNSADRCREYYDWLRKCRISRFSTLDRIAIFPDTGTIMPNDTWQLLNWTTLLTDGPKDETRRNLAAEIFVSLDIEFYASPVGKEETLPHLQTVEGDDARFSEPSEREREIARLDGEGWPIGTVLRKTTLPARRVRIVRRAPNAAPLDDVARCRELLRSEPADLGPTESVRFVEYRPGYLALEARLDRPSEIVLAEQFWPGWNAAAAPLSATKSDAKTVSAIDKPQDLTIQKDELGVGVRRLSLPAGAWRVEMRYRPPEVRLGIILTLAALFAGIFFALGGIRLFRRKPVN